jgi:hypothetical protein
MPCFVVAEGECCTFRGDWRCLVGSRSTISNAYAAILMHRFGAQCTVMNRGFVANHPMALKHPEFA